MNDLSRRSLIALIALLVSGCPSGADDDDSAVTGDDDDSTAEPAHGYAFASRFVDGADSVNTAGQVFRHVLTSDLKARIGGMTDRLNGANGPAWFPVPGEVEAELSFYFEFDSGSSGSIDHGITTTPAPLQTTYDDISAGKDLVGKLAGNDPLGQHRDWSTEFIGWGVGGSTTPEALLRRWFSELDAAAVAWSTGTIPLDPSGAPVPSVFVTAEGRDLQQLIQKFLDGAIGFSQGADDYLDDDIDQKGLLSDHTLPDGDGAAYTALEHAWDEGFGYFGAARDVIDWTDDEIVAGARDTFAPDGAIDLLSEVCWGHSVNAAKRDLGASKDAPTDFTTQAWEAFKAGRQIIADADGALDEAELTALRAERDKALEAWERAIAATIVHYINLLLQDLDTYPNEDFATVAKHWSELKGFALALQFNRRSPMLDDFQALHGVIKDAPLRSSETTAAINQWKNDLAFARNLVGTAYGFDAANLGDSGGLGGW